MGILQQEFFTFSQAAQITPGRPHKNTITRWADRGIGGVRLESWRCGGKRVTSVEALERFILARSGESKLASPDGCTPSHAAAEAALDQLGVK